MKKITRNIVLVLVLMCGFYSASAQSDSLSIEEDDIIFTRVEKEASFPGGVEEWRKFLSRNLDVNVPIRKKARPGTYTVIVKFIVSKNGKISDVVAETNHGFGFEAEAIRVIKKSRNWIPAMQNGKNVNAYRRQPIVFQISL